MTDDNNLNIGIDLDAIQNVKKQYKKLKKYMRSGIYQVKTMDGTERVVSQLLKDNENVT